jgi:hypothetical protein
MFSSTKTFNRIEYDLLASQSTTTEIKDLRHTFTPQEASKLLPDIRIRIKQLIEQRRVIAQLHNELEKYGLLGFTTAETAEKGVQLDAMVEAWKKRVDEVEDLGVIVRDLEWGIVDFPADRYGKRVMLCWRCGEPEVSYWHEINEQYPDRKPLKARMVKP